MLKSAGRKLLAPCTTGGREGESAREREREKERKREKKEEREREKEKDRDRERASNSHECERVRERAWKKATIKSTRELAVPEGNRRFAGICKAEVAHMMHIGFARRHDAQPVLIQFAMGWLRLVGSVKLQISFAKEPYKRDFILQKRRII